MESSYLKTFLEVVRTGSFTKAADVLCLTQSAVSRRIQYMEKQYESCLLDRSGPILKQTAKGQLLLDKAMKIIAIEQELELDMKAIEGQRNLSFISTPTFGAAFLPQIMGSFVRSQSGAVSLKFFQDMPEKIREHLNNGAFEIAVIEHCPEFDLSDFQLTSLPDDELVFAVASLSKFSNSRPELEELFNHALLSCASGCCSRVIFEKNLESKGYTKENFKQFIEITDLEMLLRSLIAGVGIAFLPLVLIRKLVDSGQICTFKFDDFVHYRKRTLVSPAKPSSCSLSQRFADQIVSFFAQN